MTDNHDRDTHDHDMTYENESSLETYSNGAYSIKEYDELRQQQK